MKTKDKELPPVTTTSAVLPTGTVTFVLTDVVGSSRLWETNRQAMATASARLYEIVDECVVRWHGVRPVEQGEGDSTVSVFTRAADAVRAALDVQLAVQSEAWSPGAPLDVRIGTHTGDAQLRDGNYVGPTLNRCARIRDLGRGGQILMSATTGDLVEDSLPEDGTLVDRGEHRLRGLARPERVQQLCHPALPADMAPLAADAATRSNLPVQLTSFVGREAELSEVQALVRERRLVTLIGSGGCGKTRLALEVARAIEGGYAEGVHWVDLGALADPDAVPSAVASALQVREVPAQDVSVTLVNELRDREALIVLDNCEHLAEASAALADALLRSCSQVKLFATSREPLATAGETTWHVPSLSLPAVDADVAEWDQLLTSEAVRLFVERATDARPRFRVTSENAGAIAAICRRLDGLPLAIELAASRTRSMTPQQIADGLADRFRLLTGGSRTALARQRTLEASVDWSHDLLGEAERLVFRRLSVFAGGFTLEAAEYVVSGDGIDEMAVLDLLTHLVDRSLVQIDESGGDGRYQMLETVRDYARHKLTDAGEAPAVRDRHLDYHWRLVDSLPDDFTAALLESWLDAVEADYDNVRVAMDWSVESRKVDIAQRLPAGLNAFWATRTGFNEARARAEAALALDGGNDASRALALTTSVVGATRYVQEAPIGLERLSEAFRLARAADDERTVRRVGSLLGWTRFLLEGNVDEARELLQEVVASAEAAHDHFFIAHALTSLGLIELIAGHQASAKSYLRRAVEVPRTHGDRFNLQRALVWSGLSEIWWTSLDEARRLLDEAVMLGRQGGDQTYFANALSLRASVAMHRGQYDAARADLNESLEIARRAELDSAMAVAEAGLADLFYREGDLAESRTHAEHARHLASSLRQHSAKWVSLEVLSRIELACGNREDARREAREAVSSFGAAIRMSHHPARVVLADVALQDGELEEAERLAHEHLELSADAGLPHETLLALEALARVAVQAEDWLAAARLFAAAQTARDALGCVRPPVETPAQESDVAAIREALGEAFGPAWADGAALTLEDAVAYARRARGERGRPSHGWASLTPTEEKVVVLVCEGLTNPKIGERLFIAPGTVRIHLSHVFRKLDVSTRAELAAAATRRGM